ncbi:uncharacterized protein LOC123560352 [Mercenaria mercenaria]|uniref:uncharacterized protein LOC123560352 n=1 Tax=Mercenaria mercenaria TaxID=6596 RepID=UPI00234E786F|nr:uncharacterized protein LOC123560352 [Mercenaria mercenaria]
MTNHPSDTESDDINCTEETDYLVPNPYGNLHIYDNNTNKPILNTRQTERAKLFKRKRSYSSTQQYLSSSDSCSNTLTDEVPGRQASGLDVYRLEKEKDCETADSTSLSVEFDRENKGRKDDSIRQTQCKQKDYTSGYQSPMESHDCTREMQEHGTQRICRKQYRPRANRVVDQKSVHFEPGDKSHYGMQGCQYSKDINPGQNRKSQRSRANRVIDNYTDEYNRVKEFKNSINNENEEILDNRKETCLCCREECCCILL